MAYESEINVVVFEVAQSGKEPAKMTVRTPTRVNDAIAGAWRAIKKGAGASEADVLRIYSEWEPTAQDVAFASKTFPKAGLTFSFKRPADDAWDDAFQKADAVIRKATSR